MSLLFLYQTLSFFEVFFFSSCPGSSSPAGLCYNSPVPSNPPTPEVPPMKSLLRLVSEISAATDGMSLPDAIREATYTTIRTPRPLLTRLTARPRPRDSRRIRFIALCFARHLGWPENGLDSYHSIAEVNETLALYGEALYPRRLEEAVMIFALEHGYTAEEYIRALGELEQAIKNAPAGGPYASFKNIPTRNITPALLRRYLHDAAEQDMDSSSCTEMILGGILRSSTGSDLKAFLAENSARLTRARERTRRSFTARLLAYLDALPETDKGILPDDGSPREDRHIVFNELMRRLLTYYNLLENDGSRRPNPSDAKDSFSSYEMWANQVASFLKGNCDLNRTWYLLFTGFFAAHGVPVSDYDLNRELSLCGFYPLLYNPEADRTLAMLDRDGFAARYIKKHAGTDPAGPAIDPSDPAIDLAQTDNLAGLFDNLILEILEKRPNQLGLTDETDTAFLLDYTRDFFIMISGLSGDILRKTAGQG